MKELDIQPCIHILDCTKVLVNLDNENYENSSVVKIDGENMRGYKLGVLRGVLDDSGIAEEVVFGTLNTAVMFSNKKPSIVINIKVEFDEVKTKCHLIISPKEP